MSVATKLARIVTFLDRLLILKSYKALITWSARSRDKQTIISPLPVSGHQAC